jgi:hypothetical protein
MPSPTLAARRRAEKIIAECRRWHPQFRRDCVDFVAAVMTQFFAEPVFDGNVFSDNAIDRLRRSPRWRRTREIAEAIAAAKAGDFVIAALTSAELGQQHGHMAVVVGEDGRLSGTVVVPIAYAGSLGGAAIHGERLSGTFRASLVRGQRVHYYIATPDIEPAADPLAILRHVELLTESTPGRPAPVVPIGATTTTVPGMAYGRLVTPEFRRKVFAISARLGIEVDHLMAVMAFESAGTFRSDIRNPHSGAIGLIQFMPRTATQLGTTTHALAEMSPEAQLDWVERYFQPWKGRMTSLADTYMAVLWPRALGKPDDYALFSAPSKAYQQNKGLDRNRDGRVTKHEAAWRVQSALTDGLTKKFYG